MSGDPADLGEGVEVGTYAGPAGSECGSRRRWQLSVIHPDTGERQIVQLCTHQYDALERGLTKAR